MPGHGEMIFGCECNQEKLSMGTASIPNVHQVLAQRADDFRTLPVIDAFAKLFESDVDYIVMMKLLGRNFAAEFQP
jgi:hypothetical protein